MKKNLKREPSNMMGIAYLLKKIRKEHLQSISRKIMKILQDISTISMP